ncbi:MAG TPA: lipoprotein-releasing ABC transporter permease subunit [Alphaproteobacteria bacterium]|nr:lipoprotein-releasing ABC transporter permease subunit [Alphaproteobacteria bacterium]HNS44573.1 lipoprotein-releasing ABC transporter permease subunit [Alphaproteobacteria bacterium]
MFSAFEIMVAMRYLRARKAEGFVSVIAAFSFLGIMLGVATLIIVMSVMNGFHIQLVERIVGLNGHLNVYTQGGPVQNFVGLLNDVEQVDGVVSAAPVVEGQVLVTAGGTATGAIARGFTKEYMDEKPLLATSILEGNVDGFEGNSVAIGVKMAERFNLGIGDTITLMSPKGKSSPFGTIPRTGQYKVVMIFDVGMYEYNSGYVFMPLDTAQRFFQMPETAVSLLEVMTDSPDHVDKVKEGLGVVLAGRAGVYDWRDSNASFFSAVEVERNVMFIILLLIVVIAAFNIISSMIMLVNDKARGIAIMRTMGAYRSSILKIFILTGASVGILGTAMGAVLGILFAMNIEGIRRFLEGLTDTTLFPDEIYFLSKLPAVIDWTEVLFIIMIAVVLSVLATVYPARRAANLDPVEALRYE